MIVFDINCVLLLEDEPFIALDLEDILKSAGVANVITMDTREQAEGWLAANTPNIAIIDPNLKDGFCSVIARTLVERAVPFVVYSGDPEATKDREPAFGAGVWLSKPCLPNELLGAVAKSVRQT